LSLLAPATRRGPSGSPSARRPEPGTPPPQPPSPRWSTTVRAYVALTKPRIIELLLVTTVPPMILAARGMPSWWLIVATLLGGSLAAGSANTINCYVDRDIDQVMRRTSRRPLARAQVGPVAALRFGLVLGVAATLWLGFLVNWPSALLADAAILFYVFVYTLGLKRRSSSNIVIGGAAGCFPVIIGWSAVTGTVGWPAVLLFLVVFLWTPPHFWALAMRFRDDYAAAGVPMLPVVASPVTVARRIVIYSWLMVAASLLLVPVAHSGWLYIAAAAGSGAWFLAEAHGLLWRVSTGRPPRTMRLFHLSITYLTLLFLAVAIDQLV
jgi:protoheme IX farnesyltransferase